MLLWLAAWIGLISLVILIGAAFSRNLQKKAKIILCVFFGILCAASSIYGILTLILIHGVA